MFGRNNPSVDIDIKYELIGFRKDQEAHNKLAIKILMAILAQQEKQTHLLEKMVKKQGEIE